MKVTKCDLCEKVIDYENDIKIKATVAKGYMADDIEVCRECGAPIYDFFKGKDLIQRSDKTFVELAKKINKK